MGTTAGGRTVNYQRATALDVGFAGFGFATRLPAC